MAVTRSNRSTSGILNSYNPLASHYYSFYRSILCNQEKGSVELDTFCIERWYIMMVCVHLIDRNSGRPAQCLVQQEIGNVVDHVGQVSPNTKIRNTGDKSHKYRQLIDHYYRNTSFCTLFSAVSRHIFVVIVVEYDDRVVTYVSSDCSDLYHRNRPGADTV
jgi:hypothetical protein